MEPDLRIFRGLQELTSPGIFGPCVLTIGNFDGLHAGHRQILQRVVERAAREECVAAVLTFDPHPTKVVAPDRAPRLLSTMEQRCALMGGLGIERILLLPFDWNIARLTPEEFVFQILVEKLQARAVLVGEGFRFGAKAAGNTVLLAELGLRYGFTTEIVPAIAFRGKVVSSSDIRRAIASGEVARAARLLKRPYFLEGEIVSGHGIGSKQTVPTLNLKTSAEVLPANGVYITRTRDLGSGGRWPSITNIGIRPTFDGDALTIETFLLGALERSTPSQIRLEFLHRIRDERKFDNPEALKAQIMRDVKTAQKYFRRTASNDSRLGSKPI